MAALAACQFSFTNPAERLGVGQISGRTVADPLASGTAAPVGGISVSLKGSTYDQVTHDTGRFTLIPLPAGKHTLLFRKDTSLALVRHVEVGLGPGGQPDGVTLGDVLIPFAGSLSGTVSVTDHDGLAVDEASGETAEVAYGRFQLDAVSLGDHVIKVGLLDGATGDEWVGGPEGVTLGPGAEAAVTALGFLPLHLASSAPGTVRFRVVSLHPDIPASAIAITVSELLRGPLGGVPAPDPGGTVEVVAAEGVYQVQIAPPAAFAGVVPTPPAATAVVVAGELADLGTLYLVPVAVPAAAQLLCQAAEDCAPTGACAGGSCQGWSPPVVVPARTPLCQLRTDFCSPAQPCTTGAGLAGACASIGSGSYQACIPCGTECTADGIDIHLGSCP